jgi:succinate dehydrogenase/fumarate reductase flavoprotein subunit
VASLGDLGIADRSMFWNTEFVEVLELENLLAQASVIITGRRGAPHRDPRRPCARGLPRARL